ncbi:MAG: hypothetical protein IPP46_04730 [Bacteroidetes bacterium]|nr:hypothetical protein [Bacteroidota bacterium]
MEAQNIVTTIAGNGTSGFGGDGGLASNAMIGNVSGVATDALGNIYFADFSNARIRKINSAGIITTIAGNGTLGSTGDGGLAVNAQIAPAQIALDAMGNLYFGENVKVRKITMSTGIITTVAGTGALGHSGDGGLAVNATFDYIDGITVDAAGNIFITDNNAFVVRKVTASTGIINIYAGNGTNTYSGDGGQAINAGLGLCEQAGGGWIRKSFYFRCQ